MPLKVAPNVNFVQCSVVCQLEWNQTYREIIALTTIKFPAKMFKV